MSDRNCVRKYDRVCIKIYGESQVSFQEEFGGVHYSGFLVLRRSLRDDLCYLLCQSLHVEVMMLMEYLVIMEMVE